ncbi:WD40 repeat-like protein [Ceratobasidium sp. AG-I]|nr:WD40 repeat-like protein [Ceratobasidium sp. AG-I]
MQQNPIHQQQQQQHLLSQQQHLQQQQHHNPQQQQQPQQQHHGLQQQHQGQGQQGQFGPQNGGGVGPPPPNGQDMSLASVLHYLQTEWRRYERERNEWEIERAEMRARIALLEGERRSFDNLKIDWTRRIKMLEYALKVERTKQVNQPATSAPSTKLASLRKEDDSAPLKEGSGSSSPRSEDIPLPGEQRAGAPSIPGLPNSRPQSIAGINGLASQSAGNPLATKMTGRDPKSRARSKDYLKQCLQEVNYLTSPQAVNPLPNRPLVSLGPTSTVVGSSAQSMGQPDGQHQQQTGSQQHQPQHPQHLSQHQPITVALPNLPPFPSITAMNESNQLGSGNDTIGFNGRPRKLVPEVGKDFPLLNGALEPSLMPASVGNSRDPSDDARESKQTSESMSEIVYDPVDEPMSGHEEEPLAPIPIDEPEPEQEQEQEQEQEPHLEQQEARLGSPFAPQDSIVQTAKSGGIEGFASDRNLVTAIFRPDDQGEWKKKLQEAHDAATRNDTGLENISLGDEFGADDLDSVGSTEEESEDKAKVWKTRKTLRNHLDAVRAVAFHPSEMCLASGGDDFTIKIWRLDPSALTSNSRQAQQTTDIEPQLTLRGHTAAITCLVASQRGLLFSASMDASIRIWSFPPESLQPYAPFDPSYFHGELVGHTDVVWGLALVRDGSWLASGGADGMVKVWEVSDKGGQLRLSWGYNGTEHETPEGQDEEIVPVVAVEGIKSDLRKVAVAYANCVVKVFDIESGKELAKLGTDETYDGTADTQINAIASHPTMPLLVTAHEDKYIRIFDIATGECQHSMLAHLDTVTTLSIDTTGFSLVSGSHDGSIRFWDILGSRTCVQEINAHRQKSNEGTLDVRFHPSMPFIASAGADGVVKIYAS